jgi:antagonist of KipI
MFEVISGGVMTTVQDLGRPGYYSVGIPVSGAMDRFSLKCGNILLKNELNEACLEVLLYGLKLRVLKDVMVAITGADMSPEVNGREVRMWETIKLRENDIIRFPRIPEHGCRAYLCVKGGIEVPRILGSKSTFINAQFGGFEGRALRKGDIIPGGTQGTPSSYPEGRKLQPSFIPTYSNEAEVRVILGPQDIFFTDESLETFLTYPWRVSSKANREGIRYEEEAHLSFKPRSAQEIQIAGGHISNICPAGTPFGGIQVPLGTEVIVICCDGPTRGGYAKIATVIDADIDKLGQLKPGDVTRFKKVNIEEAYRLSENAHNPFNIIQKQFSNS